MKTCRSLKFKVGQDLTIIGAVSEIRQNIFFHFNGKIQNEGHFFELVRRVSGYQ